MAENKKADSTKCWWACETTGTVYLANENIKYYIYFGKQFGGFL